MFLSYSSHKHTPTSQLRRAFAKVKFRTASDNWAVRTKNLCAEWGDGYVCPVFGGEMEPLLWEGFSLGSFTSPLFCCPLPFRFCSSPTGQHRTCWFHKLSQTPRSVRRKEKRGTLQPKDQSLLRKKISISRSSQILPIEFTMEGACMKWKMGFTTTGLSVRCRPKWAGTFDILLSFHQNVCRSHRSLQNYGTSGEITGKMCIIKGKRSLSQREDAQHKLESDAPSNKKIKRRD